MPTPKFDPHSAFSVAPFNPNASFEAAPRYDFSSLTANPKGEGTYKITTPDGQSLDVPYSKVPVFQGLQGTKFASAADEKRFTRDAAADPSSQSSSGARKYWEGLTNPLGSGAVKTPTLEDKLAAAPLQVGGQAIKTMAQPFIHPLDTLGGAAKTAAYLGGKAYGVPMPEEWNPVVPAITNYLGDKERGGNALALENLAGQALGTYEGGRMMGAAAKPVVSRILPPPWPGTVAPIDVPTEAQNAAALRGLGIGAKSPKALRTLGAVQGSRPFLTGATSLEDLQARIPGAKAEIWEPYENAVQQIGDKKVMGPDGPTTVGALEQERLQTSALNRALKQRNPEAIQLAQQKGMTQADLLARENAIRDALDPHLEEAGIKPQDIRRAFGQVSQVGERVSGKSTLTEQPQRYGLGRIANFDIKRPFNAPADIFAGAKDILQGRPWWSGKPTDIAIREGFAPGGPKPYFGYVKPPVEPLQLPASTIGNAPFGAEPMAGGFPGRPSVVTPAPSTPLRLPAAAAPGESVPMLRYARPYVEPPEPGTIRPMPPPQFLRLPETASPGETQPYIAHRLIESGPAGETTRFARPEFLPPQQVPPIGGTITPPLPPGAEGPVIGIRPGVRGALPAPTPTEAATYPPGSIFRASTRPFDLEEYLKQNAIAPASRQVPPIGEQ